MQEEGTGETMAENQKRVWLEGGAMFMVQEDLGNPGKSGFQFFDPPSQGLWV